MYNYPTFDLHEAIVLIDPDSRMHAQIEYHADLVNSKAINICIDKYIGACLHARCLLGGTGAPPNVGPELYTFMN